MGNTQSSKTDDAYETFGKRVVQLRTEYGLSQTQVAESIGIPLSTYSGYETGVRKIPLSVLKKIAFLFKTSVDYLIGYDGDEEIGSVTIAAHHDGDDWTEEELEFINLTKKVLIAKRKKTETKDGI